MTHIKHYIFLLLGVILLSGCITPRRVDYLQDMTQGTQIQIEDRFEATIAPYDELNITIMSSTMDESELASPFNHSEMSVYLVDVDGNIDMPTLGKIRVAGMTRLQLQDELADRIRKEGFMSSPFVNVRFTNFKIFCLVGGKGQVLNVTNERCTFLEALAMMGGLDNFTQRDHIAVMREVNGRMVMRYLDPRSSDIFNDPFFLLQQNDFIIAPSYNAGTILSNLSLWTGLFSTVMSAASLVVSIMLLQSKNN